MKTSPKLIVLAAGGTGGHVFPAEALAKELTKRGYRLCLITDRRGVAYGGALGNLETHRISAGGIAGKGLMALLRSCPELAIGTLKSRSLLKDMQPSAVVGFGGYASVPTLLAATFAGFNTIIHEQNAVLGRANRFLANRVRRIATSFAEVRLVPKSAMQKVKHTGMPVRPEVASIRDVPYPEFNESEKIRLLVLGGSQGASILSKVIPDAIARLDTKIKSRLEVTQQCRPEDLNGTRAAYQSISIKAELESFFNDIPDRIANAHLLICRAGASTVSEVMTVGRPAILVPYPFAIDDHQTFNAHALDEAGGGWLMAQDNFTPDGLADRLSDLFNAPKTLRHAAECARVSGHRDAAVKLADFISDQMDKKDTGRRAA